jgi:hypothetical protein
MEGCRYTTQLIERIAWATADAEALESQVFASELNAESVTADSISEQIAEPLRAASA